MSLNYRRTALTAALVAAFTVAGTTVAQTAMPAPGASATPMHGHGHHDSKEMKGRWKERHDQHMAELKKSLQLTPAQEGAWSQFTTAMRPPATPPQRPDREALARMTTPERIDQMRAMRQQHHAEMDRRAEATKAFYGALTPEQKKTFDAHTARYMNRHHAHGSHHG